METIKNAIWGTSETQSGEEPVSGQTGDGTADKPYDAGNTKGQSGTTGEYGSSGTTGDSTTGGSSVPTATSDTLGASDPTPSTAEVSASGESKAPVGGFGTVEPSVGANLSSTDQPEVKQPGVDKPLDEPTGEQHPDDHSGDPLKGEGTGEKYVKTSGMAADGGDFDATKPGAGKEADRLLEQKGVHHEPGPAKTNVSSEPDTPSKTKFSTKLKEKLHIGKSKS